MPTGSGEHLTEAEMDKLRATFKCNRHGHWDWLIKLVIYRHGLRISQTCDLRWDDIDLPKRTNWCRSVPGPISVPVPGPIRPRDWLAAVAAAFIIRASTSTIKNRLPIDFPIDFGTQVTTSLCCS
jgi:integrase